MKKLFSIFALILLMVGFKAQAKDVYAVVSGKTMTIKYLDTKPTGGYTVDEWTAHADYFVPNLHATIHDVVETIVIDYTMKDVKPTSTSFWFSNFIALKQIQNIQYLNTSEVVDMSYMFYKCGLLESIDLSGFNTDNVTTFQCLFHSCASLKELDLSTFNTANAESVLSMFYSCSKLKRLDLAHFNTANVKRICYMFGNCTSLEEVDIRNFTVENVKEIHSMFEGCSQLRTIYCVNDWSGLASTITSTEKENVFKGCTSLVGGKNSACDGASDIDVTFARLDGISDKKGYFTAPKEVYTEYADGVLTYKYDNERLYSANKTAVYDPDKPRFSGYNNDVVSAVIDPSMKEANLTTTNMMFYGKGGSELSKMETISGMENLNTENVTDMNYMFYYCRALESVDLRGLNTAKVTGMYGMFSGCSSLKELDLSSFNTSNVTDMMCMFYNCSALEKVNLSSFNTSNVTRTMEMFEGCSSLKEVDLSSFNTPKLEIINYMFKDCYALEKVDLSMFNTSEVTSMVSLFEDCKALKEVDLSGFDTKKVKDVKNAFKNCAALKTIYCSGDWSVDNSIVNADYKKNLFYGCTALEGGKDTKYNSSYVDIDYARMDGVGGNKGYFTPANTVYTEYEDGVLTYRYDHNAYYSTKNAELYDPDKPRFKTYYGDVKKAVIDPSMKEAKLTTTQNMFFGTGSYKLIKLETIEGLENLNTSEVTDMNYMFGYCYALKELDLSTFDTRKVTNIRALFYECNALEQLNISSFRTPNVTNMQSVFYNCKALESLDLSGFNTRNVTTMYCTFAGCSKLEQVDLSSFNTANVTNIAYMFVNCVALKELNLNNFNIDKVTTSQSMFNGCTVLKTIYCNDIWPKPSTSTDMFKGCKALVGGNETAYSDSYTDITYARLDGYGDMKGYFTATAEVYTEYEDGVLTYRYDDQRHKSYKKAEKYDPNKQRFAAYRTDIIKAVIDPSMKDANLKTTVAMFYGWLGNSGYGLKNLETIEGLENLKTENVLDMYYMFGDADELRSLDLSHFNTAKVENMRSMFYDCERLKTVDISSFQMDNVVDASYMFYYCPRLATIYHNGDWTKSDMTADYMFSGCKRLVGRSGTKFNSSDLTNKTYARLDGGKKHPGYFTGVYRVTLEAENGSANVNESGVNLNHVLEGTKLTFSATPNEGYVLSGWTNYNSGSSLTVTDNVTVTANFKLQTFTVTFYDWNNTVLKTETVEYGKAATAPENPVREGYEFAGWDTDFSNVKSNLTVRAQYKSTEGIDNVDVEDNPQKIVRDGQIYILRGEKMYDMTGKAIK